jgi:hypothetical protein
MVVSWDLPGVYRDPVIATLRPIRIARKVRMLVFIERAILDPEPEAAVFLLLVHDDPSEDHGLALIALRCSLKIHQRNPFLGVPEVPPRY